MTARQKKALADFSEDAAAADSLEGDQKLEVLRRICQQFLDESRFIRSEAGPEYDV